jgi:phosphatidylglycerol---prolipoprotein diacylglyceryl transferase
VTAPSAYLGLMLLGLAISAWLWARLVRRNDRLLVIYVIALLAAFLGAKLAYLLAEGWREVAQPDFWKRLATGKSILGALLGGYAGVELAKRWLGYHGMTGDWFARIVPVGVILGRIGCGLHGCCLGQPLNGSWFASTDAHGIERWPAVPMEIAFNVVCLGLVLIWSRRGFLRGQQFHVYLIAYGLFRFGHEFFRSTPRIVSGLSGYHLMALALAMFGALAFYRRAQIRRTRFGEVDSSDDELSTTPGGRISTTISKTMY